MPLISTQVDSQFKTQAFFAQQLSQQFNNMFSYTHPSNVDKLHAKQVNVITPALAARLFNMSTFGIDKDHVVPDIFWRLKNDLFIVFPDLGPQHVNVMRRQAMARGVAWRIFNEEREDLVPVVLFLFTNGLLGKVEDELLLTLWDNVPFERLNFLWQHMTCEQRDLIDLMRL